MAATNTRRVVEAANGKPVFSLPIGLTISIPKKVMVMRPHRARGWCVCTAAHASRWNGVPVGTIPHSLIAVSGGETTKATQRFAKHIQGANIVALVDFDNDCVGTSLAVAKAHGKKVVGVRLDTAGNLIDKSLSKNRNTKNTFGVNPLLVWAVRKALNDNGYAHVKILVSGGFTEDKVRMFEKEKRR